MSMRGNALFFILIAIVLLSALFFAVTRGQRDNQNALSKDQARLAAIEMIQYAGNVRIVVDKMIALGAAAETTPTLFAQSGTNTYGVAGTTPTAEVFHANGGALSTAVPPAMACTSPCAYEFTGQIAVTGMGTDPGGDEAYELSLVVAGLQALVCAQLNDVLKLGTTIPTDGTLNLHRFVGTYGAAVGDPVTLTGLSGQKSFCYQESAGAQRYVFVTALRVR